MQLFRGPPADPHTCPSEREPESEAEHVVDHVPALAGTIERRGGKLDRFDRERQEGGTDDRESHHARSWQQCDQGAERDEQKCHRSTALPVLAAKQTASSRSCRLVGLPVAMLHVTADGADSVEATRFALSPTVTFRDAAASRPCG